jgi:hypothetical protein
MNICVCGEDNIQVGVGYIRERRREGEEKIQ